MAASPLTPAERRAIMIVPPPLEAETPALAASIPAAVSGFVSVIRIVESGDPQGEAPTAFTIIAPPDKNWESAGGTRKRRLAFVYGLWQLQSTPTAEVFFGVDQCDQDIPAEWKNSDFPRAALFEDNVPPTPGGNLWTDPWVKLPCDGPLAPAPIELPDMQTGTLRLCRKIRDLRANLRQKFRNLFRGRRRHGPGAWRAISYGAMALAALGIGFGIKMVIDSLARAGGNCAADAGRVITVQDIPDCSQETGCCAVTGADCPPGPGPPRAGQWITILAADCSTKCLDTCKGTVGDVTPPPPSLTNFLLLGLLGLGALGVLAFALSRRRKDGERRPPPPGPPSTR